jgi:membrane-associated protein
MEWIIATVDALLHLDRHLQVLIAAYGGWVYVLLFLIIFCETGLVVTPFLPGDSLLFVVGALAGAGLLDLGLVMASLSIAAILGNTVNYWIGARVGPAVFQREDSRWFKRRHLERAREFYERHGGKTIIITRFIPIVRTFAPFVAGIARMPYRKFLAYNAAGGLAWVLLFVGAGYWFGDLPVVKENLTLFIFAIIFVSLLPGMFEYLRQRGRN